MVGLYVLYGILLLIGRRRNVDFAAESSDEEDDNRSGSQTPTDNSTSSSLDEDIIQRPEDHAVDTLSQEQLQNIQAAQFWRKSPNVGGVRLETVKTPITELQAIREVLLMLGGSPTSMFEIRPEQPLVIEPSKKFSWTHSSAEAYAKLAKSLANWGSSLARLRSWTRRNESIPLVQVLQGSMLERLDAFDRHLTTIEARFLAPIEDVVVSLLQVQAELGVSIRPLLRLAEVIEKMVAERYGHAFRYLELLFDETCTSQMAGDLEMYEFMGKMFFQCFQVYLRPIRSWMEEGELSPGDKVFFVAETPGEIELSSLWKSRYKIRKTQDGVLHAPRFLSAAAKKIFTAGKSVIMLQHLNQFEVFKAGSSTYEPRLDFETVCNPTELGLAPFPELFDMAFDAWVQSKHHHASLLLKMTLFDTCGLRKSLDALPSIYFLSDGSITSTFAHSIFHKLDTLNASWNDGFLLTELAQSTIGTLPAVNPDRLRVHILSLLRKQQDVATCRRTVKALAIIEMRYNLSWPIQNIIRPSTIACYKRIFTFLLQIRRSTSIVSRSRIIKDSLALSDSSAIYFSLRTALLWFNQMLYYYLTAIVLEPATQQLHTDLKEAEDVDAMIEVHAVYIKSMMDRSLLGSKLELIHKTVLKILDLGIKMEDARKLEMAREKEEMEQQQEMMDVSIASLGLTPTKSTSRPSPQLLRQSFRQSFRRSAANPDPDSEDESAEEVEADVDLSILSAQEGNGDEVSYLDKMSKMKGEFDRLVRFVASGLRGVARAGEGERARSWDLLGEMLEGGLAGEERTRF